MFVEENFNILKGNMRNLGYFFDFLVTYGVYTVVELMKSAKGSVILSSREISTNQIGKNCNPSQTWKVDRIRD